MEGICSMHGGDQKRNRAPCHEGVLVEWRYSYTHSLTSAPDGGEW
jgi:hypothetical protein